MKEDPNEGRRLVGERKDRRRKGTRQRELKWEGKMEVGSEGGSK